MDFFKAQFTKIPRVAQVNLSASTVLVTGANTGLGLEAAREIVKSKPRRLILAVRNVDKGNAAKKALETAKGGDTSIEVRKLDQASFASVQAFAKDLEGEPIDIAILNAGVWNTGWTVTSDGYESDIQVNTISPALLSLLLLPNLRLAASSHENKHGVKPHLSIVSSGLHEMAKFKESEKPAGQILTTLNDQRQYKPQDRYPTSKVIGLLWTKELAARVPSSEVIINAPNPGFCKTGLMANQSGIMKYVVMLFATLFGRSAEDGARCIVDAAVAKGPESHGRYLSETAIKKEAPLVSGAGGAELQKKLWAETLEHLQQSGISPTLL